MRPWLLPMLALTLSFPLTGCDRNAEPGAEASSPESPVAAIGAVEVTNYPLAYMVERLAGSLLEVRFRAAQAVDPAAWWPSADEVVAMQEADLIVVNGAGYEPWLEDVSLPTSRLVDTTFALRDRLLAVDSTLTHSHGLEGEHRHTATAFTTWLDPTLLIEQARATGRALERAWPQHATPFSDRLAALVGDLEALDAGLEEATATTGEQPVLFSHPVYQYLERRYGLVGGSLHWEPDVVPDDAHWQGLETLQREQRARWMIWEAAPLPETAQRLEALGIRSAVVDPCATRPDQGDLLDVMRRNVEVLRTVYAGG